MSGLSGRIGDFARTSILSASAGRSSAALSDLQSKVADGKAARRISDLGFEAGRYLSTSAEIALLNTYSDNAKSLQKQLDSQTQALSTMTDVAARARALVVRAQGIDNPNVDEYDLNGQAAGLLDETLSVLNARFEGRYVFGGQVTEAPPVGFGTMVSLNLGTLGVGGGTLRVSLGASPINVDIAVAPGGQPTEVARNALLEAARRNDLGIGDVIVTASGNLLIRPSSPDSQLIVRVVPPNGFGASVTTFAERAVPPETQGQSFSYYWGGASADIQKIALGDGIAQPAGIAADQPGIEKLVRALRILETLKAAPSLDASGKASLASVLDLINGSIDQLGQLVGVLGSRQVLAEDLAASHELTRLQLQDTVDGLENLDIGEAMTRLSSNQTQLQAAYMMLARLGSLSLLNFLK